MRRSPLPAIALCLCLVLSACGGSTPSPGAEASGLPTGGFGLPPRAAPATGTALAGMPPVLDPADIYAADRPGALSPSVAGFPSLIYVPNSDSNSVDVIDPFLMKVVDHFTVGRQPQHVVPSYYLQTLYATNDMSNTLTPIDPK